MIKTKREIFYLYIYFFILLGSSSFSQTIISGNVKNIQGKLISGASITITEINSEDVISYAITDSNGKFSVLLKSNLNELQISLKKINYNFQNKQIENKTQNIDFIIIPEITELKEVIIKQSLIRKKGDTISYNVKTFADQKDRSIADVLAKMPGIEIQPDGKILYQGKQIQKYYVDGLDLLEDKYGLINNNLPFESVNSVQIIENHQPIKILDSISKSEKASLNIKLKKKITTTGIAKTGIGAFPFLWDVNTTPMLFTKKKQIVFSYQSNNTGNDVGREIKTLTLEKVFEEFENPTQKKDLLSILQIQTPNISNKRYLDNNIHLFSFNYLTKLKNETELRFNGSYLNDSQKQLGENTTQYILPTGNVILKEIFNNKIFANDLQTNLTIQKNTKKNYFKNSFKTQINWEKQLGVVLNPKGDILQKLQNPYYLFTNNLKYTTSIGKQLFTVNSFINYNQTPQNIVITPGQFQQIFNDNNSYDSIKQILSKNVFQTNQNIEFTKNVANTTIISKIGVNTQNSILNNSIDIDGVSLDDEFRNNQNISNYKFYFQPAINIKKNSWEFKLQLPISYNLLKIENSNNENQSKKVITINPNIQIKNEINSYLKTNINLEFSNDFNNFNEIINGYLLNNYRSLTNNNYPITQNKIYKFSTGTNYRNPTKSLFASLYYTFNKTQNPFVFENVVDDNGRNQLFINKIENNTYLQNISAKTSKYFDKLKTGLTLSLDLNLQETIQFINSQILNVKNQNINPSFKIDTRFATIFSVNYEIETNFNKNKTGRINKQEIFNLTEKLKLNIYPLEKIYLGVDIEHYYNSFIPIRKNNFYADLIGRYTIKKKNIDLEVKCTNMFNEKKYITTSFTDFYLFQSDFLIRPRQVVAIVKFNF